MAVADYTIAVRGTELHTLVARMDLAAPFCILMGPLWLTFGKLNGSLWRSVQMHEDGKSP
jgi:hypothetical protein